MLELILECGSWLHRSCQFHEVVMKRRSHCLELALKSSHRFEAVSQVLQMAVESLNRFEGCGHVSQLLLEPSYRLPHRPALFCPGGRPPPPAPTGPWARVPWQAGRAYHGPTSSDRTPWLRPRQAE